MRSLARTLTAGPSPVAGPRPARPGEYHHAHPHPHGRRGVHDHRHGHRGSPVSRRGEQVPSLHWFAEHAHVHPEPTDEDQLEAPRARGAGSVR